MNKKLPLTISQQALFFDQISVPDMPYYNIGGFVRINGQLNEDIFSKMIEMLPDIFDMLTVDFSLEENQLVQQFGVFTEVPFEIISVEHEDDPEALVSEQIRQSFNQPFRMGEGRLLDLKLYKLSDNEYWWVNKFHHIVTDALGVHFYTMIASEIYEALIEGKEPEINSIIGSYQDQLRLDKEYVESSKYQKDKDFWQEKFATLPEPLLQPSDQTAENKFARCRNCFVFDDDTRIGLEQLAQQTKGGMQQIGLAAVATYFSRVSGQDDLAIGVVVHRRKSKALRNMLGTMASDLPCRVMINEGDTIKDLIASVSTELRQNYRHQNYPLNYISRDLKLQAQGRSQLIDINFNYEPGMAPLLFNGAISEPCPRFSEFDRDVFQARMCDYPGQPLRLYVDFRLDYISESEGRMMAERIMYVFQQMVLLGPDANIADIDIIPPAEKQLMASWQQTEVSYPENQCIQSVFERQVMQSPDAIAVIHDGQHLQYQHLNAKSNKLAHYLRAQGVQPNTLVGLCVERNIDMVIAIMAILKAGAAYVPMDPVNPIGRIHYMLENSDVDILLTQTTLREKYAEQIQSLNIQALCLDADASRWHDQPMTNPSLINDGQSVAYMMYTSGSTGQPKGALLHHDGVLNHIWAEFDVMSLHQPFRFLQSAASSSDVSVWQTLAPLMTGGSTVILDNMADAPKLHQLIKTEQLELIELVPSVLRLLVEYIHTLPEAKRALPSLKWMMFTGESCPVGLVNEWLSLFPKVPVMNGYGPTEASDDISYYIIDKPLSSDVKNIPIGKALPNLNLLILDQQQRIVPIGVAGELCVSGIGVGHGYWRNEEKTQQAFIANNLPDTLGETIYRTGDIGRLMADGNVEFLDRIDNQVKIRSFRVELGEIEAAIASIDVVKQTVVLAQKDSRGQHQLICYVVASDNIDVQAHISAELHHLLPEYMHPQHYVVMANFPLNTADKVDKKALPVVELNSTKRDNYQEPRNEVESDLCDIWQHLLDVEHVGIEDSFFALGGHSLLAGELIVQIKQRFGRTIPLTQLFENPTVSAIATALQTDAGTATKELKLADIVPDEDNRHVPFPLTQIQQAYWVGRSNAFELGNVSTHDYIEFDFEQFDPEKFSRVFNRLVQYHDMMRMVIGEDGQQHILQQVPEYQIRRYDFSTLDTAIAEEGLLAIRNEMHDQVLPADVWPQFEVRISHLGANKHRLHFCMDALISDAWSAGILQKQLSDLYVNPDMVLPPLQLSFRDYVLAEQNLVEQPVYQTSKQYWCDRLDNFAPAPDLPLAVNPADIETPVFVRRHARLSQPQWSAVKARAGHYNLTPSSILFTAYASVLSQWSRNKRFTLNLTLFNRLPLHEQVNDIMGDFTSLNLLEIDHREAASFLQRATALQKQLWSDLEHRYFSGIDVFRELAKRSESSQTATFPVVFTSTLGSNTEQHDSDQLLNLANANFQTSQTPQVWLDHIVEEVDGELLLSWEAVEALFPENMLDDMFTCYVQLLESLAADTAGWEMQHTTILPATQQQRRSEYNMTNTPTVNNGLLHQKFLEQVITAPDNIALCTEHEQFSYRELYNMANVLAYQLRHQGAQPNKLIAVVMEKNWQQIPAVMSILMAGAAYLPIDAKLPEERIQVLIEQGDVDTIVTTAELKESRVWADNLTCFVVDDINKNKRLPALPQIQQPSDIAYVIFTSGSTGMPKGVVIDHLGALNTVEDINQRYRVDAQDAAIALSSLSFDLSVYDVFGLLSVGGKIVIPSAEQERDPEHWWQLIQQHHVSIWNTVPALMQINVDHIEEKGTQLPNSLRLVMMSGDWIPVNLPERIHALSASASEIISLGGATEASVWSIFHSITEADANAKSIPYGRPLNNQQFYVFDQHLQPCPEYVTGDLYIGGIGLAKGYWKDQQKTNDAFITHPITQERLYRTGDLGKFLPQGHIEFIGREDHQVKLNGYRVELGEIETAIKAHDAIKEAVVAVQTLSGHDKCLVAYYRCDSDVIDIDLAELEQQLTTVLSDTLPVYMQPKYFMNLNSIPLTANGKVDRKALPVPDMPLQDLAIEPPTTDMEKCIADVWRQVLPHSNFGIQDNFFALGGDSIMSIQILSKLRNQGIQVTLEHLYLHQTIAQLAATLQSLTDTDEAPLSSTETDKFSGSFDLAPMQRWFFDQFTVQQQQANFSLVLKLKQELCMDSLQQALNAVIQHHPMLRCQYHQSEQGRWQATVADEYQLFDDQLVRYELPVNGTEQRSEYIASLQRSFDLAQGKLVGLLYLASPSVNQPGSETCASELVLSSHLLAADGVTLRIVIEDLLVAYQQIQSQQPVLLANATTAYAEWREKLQIQIQQDSWQEQLSYWQEAIHSDYAPVPVEQNTENLFADLKTHDGMLSPQQTESVLALSNQAGANQIEANQIEANQIEANQIEANQIGGDINAVLLHALSKSYYAWTGASDLLIDFETHGRAPLVTGCDLSRTAGWFTAMYPLSLNCSPMSTQAHIQQIQRQLAEVPAQGFGFGPLKYMHPDASVRALMCSLPKPQISFNHMGQFDQVDTALLSLSEEILDDMNHAEQQRPHVLDISTRVVGGQLRLHIRYSHKLHSPAMIQQLSEMMLAELVAMSEFQLARVA